MPFFDDLRSSAGSISLAVHVKFGPRGCKSLPTSKCSLTIELPINEHAVYCFFPDITTNNHSENNKQIQVFPGLLFYC